MMDERMPLIGEKVPEMTVRTTHGLKNLPGDYLGKWLILFSHPADFTPVCTTEFVAFQNRFEQFGNLNTELLGLSIDQVFAHIKWEEWIRDNLDIQIRFPIIADDGTVGRRLGVVHPGQGSNTVRAVFIVDPEGVIRAILYYPQEMGRNFDELVRMIRALQVVDAQGVATPADWPNNALIGDRVIIPPAQDVTAAAERKRKFECFDWWFCHREL